MKQNIIKAVNYLNLFSILYITASSIYYYPVQKIGFYLFFGSYFLELLLEKKWLNIKMDKNIFITSYCFCFF